MDVNTATNLLSIMEYKPGFKFSITPGFVYDNSHFMSNNAYILIIECEVIDSLNFENKVRVRIEKPIPLYLESKTHFYQFVYRCLQELECHELGEFFKVNGEQIYNPHISKELI